MSTQREMAGRITWGVTAAVAVAGIVMSADQLVHLAQLAGWAGNVRWLLPVLLDGSGIAGGLAYKFAPTAAGRRWGLVVLIESAALSVFGNVSAHMITEAVAPIWVASVVAVAVPLQIVLTVHMGILLSDQPDETAKGATSTATETPATATPETPAATPVPAAATPVPVDEVEAPSATADEAATATPAEDTQPLPLLRSVPSQMAGDAVDDATEGDGTDEADSEAPGSIREAMWAVYARHANAGTAGELAAAQLAREAGRGSRQLASRYLREWRQAPQGVSA